VGLWGWGGIEDPVSAQGGGAAKSFLSLVSWGFRNEWLLWGTVLKKRVLLSGGVSSGEGAFVEEELWKGNGGAPPKSFEEA